MGKTRIQVTEQTRDKLKTIGRKGESYDDVINWLIEELPTELSKTVRSLQSIGEKEGKSAKEVVKELEEVEE